jgi:hypothetical protein
VDVVAAIGADEEEETVALVDAYLERADESRRLFQIEPS